MQMPLKNQSRSFLKPRLWNISRQAVSGLLAISLTFMGSVSFQTRPANAQTPTKTVSSFTPIFQTELRPELNALLTLSALESSISLRLQSQQDAEALYLAIQEAKDSGKDQRPEAITPVIKQQASLLFYYFSQPQNRETRERVKALSSQLEQSAQTAAELKKSDPRLVYLSRVAKIIRSEWMDGISELIPLKNKLAADKNLAANIDLLTGYSLALVPATSAQGLQLMAGAAASLTVYGRLAQKLTETLIDSGLDGDGAAIAAAKPSAMLKLNQSVQAARGLPNGVQQLVLSTGIYIWVRTHKEAKAPSFLKDGFVQIPAVDMLKEYEALGELKRDNFKDAVALYRKITTTRPDLVAALDLRIWDIQLYAFQKNGDILALEQGYLEFKGRYPNAKNKGLASYLVESYRRAIDSTLDRSLSPAASKDLQTAGMQASLRFVKGETDRKMSYAIYSKLAQLYRNLKLYKDAVDTYLELAKDLPLKNYPLAIEAQSQLAAWPLQPFFGKAQQGIPAERSKLFSIYEALSRKKNNQDWFLLAQMGLLNRNLGQSKAAETLWMPAIKANPSPKFALESAGLLMNDWFAAQRWEELIEFSHLFAIKKLNPMLEGKPLAYKPWLAQALYQGGTSDLQIKNYPRAARYLDEFTRVFASDPRTPAASYSLAFAYKGLGKHVPAVALCKIIVEKYLSYPLRPKVLLQAGEWAATDRMTIEFAFFFYSKYLNEYKSERDIPQIRMLLAELYLKQKIYGDASRLYTEQSLAANVDRATQLSAAMKAMDIEEQFGTAKIAYSNAQRIVDLAGPNDPARLRAYAFMGRYVAQNKDLKGMADIETKLLSVAKNHKESAEALGILRFRRAEMLTKSIVYGENTLTIKDPEATVKKYFERFEDERKYYSHVCQVGITAHCAPAMLRLGEIAKQAMDAMEKVQIPDTLGPSRISSFKVFKQLYFSKTQQARKDYRDQAARLCKQGTTTNAWKEEILKSLEYEDSAEMAH